MDRLICGYPVVPKAKTLMVYFDPDYTSPYPGYALKDVMNFRADNKPYVGPVKFEYDDSITGPASVTTDSEGKATVTLTPNRDGLSIITCKFGGGSVRTQVQCAKPSGEVRRQNHLPEPEHLHNALGQR